MIIVQKRSLDSFSHKQSGAALFVSLILLMALTLIGLSAAKRSNMQERMAANIHIQNLAFNASESAIGAFIVESFTGDKILPGHLLFNLRAAPLINACYDQVGARVVCGGIFLDGDRSGVIQSRLDARVVQNCSRVACGGFSLDNIGGGVGCRVFQIDATGVVGNKTESSSLWAYELTSCVN